ncbi:response regulator [Arcicella aquatica]|uniref:Response regulator n=1 Tax=Arcicella aquatica TaxID=217141 RepID=A0ABU5QU26_9BACT|nr:response regulator [Arcicella aquatica]MEA5259851.1 response regulator [Arcicella aquatica]
METGKMILIVEDDKILAESIKLNLQKDGFVIAGIAGDSKSALSIMQSNDIDLAVIDIKLKGIDNGIVVATQIKDIKRIPIIYITGNTPYKLDEDMEKTHPAAFLEKPLRMRELSVQIDLALKNFNNTILPDIYKKESDYIFIKEVNKSFFKRIKIKEILFVEAEKMKCKIYVTQAEFSRLYSSKQYHPIEIPVPKGWLVDKLPSKFLSFHQSYLVNYDFIDKFDSTCVFIESYQIPIPEGKSKEFLKMFNIVRNTAPTKAKIASDDL